MWRVQQMFTSNSMIIQSKMYMHDMPSPVNPNFLFEISPIIRSRSGVSNRSAEQSILRISWIEVFWNHSRISVVLGKGKWFISINSQQTLSWNPIPWKRLKNDWEVSSEKNVIEHLELLRCKNLCNSSELPNDR